MVPRAVYRRGAGVSCAPLHDRPRFPRFAFPMTPMPHVATPPALPALSAQPVVPVEGSCPGRQRQGHYPDPGKERPGELVRIGVAEPSHRQRTALQHVRDDSGPPEPPFWEQGEGDQPAEPSQRGGDDYGPGVLNPDRVIDLSFGAAQQLKMIQSGVDQVRLEVLTSKNVPLVVR